MSRTAESSADWTGGRVEARLIAAFRALPSHPVFSSRSKVRSVSGAGAEHADALNWVPRFVGNSDEALLLLTWARCKATRESASASYQALGWNRSTAEEARRRAIKRIVTGLDATMLALDTRTTALVASSTAEATPDLAPA